MTAHESEIHAVHSAWIDAVNAGDLNTLFGLATTDVVFINPGQEPCGLDRFSVVFRSAHQQMRFHCTSQLEEVVVAGDVAYTRSRDALSMVPRAGGIETRFAGHRLTVYRRQADGRWRLARDAHTLAPTGT